MPRKFDNHRSFSELCSPFEPSKASATGLALIFASDKSTALRLTAQLHFNDAAMLEKLNPH
jgi:hypothetical protein